MIQLEASSYGPEIALLDGRQGIVRAVLREAIYFESENGEIVGIIGPNGAEGPITLRIRNLAALMAAGLTEGLPFAATNAAITIGSVARIDLSPAMLWQPQLPQPTADGAQIASATEMLRQTIAANATSAGFGQLAEALALIVGGNDVQQGGNDALVRMALERIGALNGALDNGDEREITTTAIRLLGLGPGLTPSGDDFLCGLLATSRWIGAASIAPSELLHAAQKSTTRLSVRLLTHAATGLLYEPAMSLGAAIFAGHKERVAPQARRLFAIGHTSGMDIATGILFGVLRYCRTQG